MRKSIPGRARTVSKGHGGGRCAVPWAPSQGPKEGEESRVVSCTAR